MDYTIIAVLDLLIAANLRAPDGVEVTESDMLMAVDRWIHRNPAPRGRSTFVVEVAADARPAIEIRGLVDAERVHPDPTVVDGWIDEATRTAGRRVAA